MPNYKSHSIHGELVLPGITKEVHIDKELLKLFCMGPDALVTTDFKTFDKQHCNLVKDYFLYLIHYIKNNKLMENEAVMAYLYGHIDHYILDSTTHPLIYYMTENIPKINKIEAHGLIESWIDDYIISKYNKKDYFYYKKLFCIDNQLNELINNVYKDIFNVSGEALKYERGLFNTSLLCDTVIRRNMLLIVPIVIKLLNIGDIIYHKDYDRVLPFLNLEHEIWTDPETNQEYQHSFDDLWNKSVMLSIELINDVNNMIYKDRALRNYYIYNDISYNTSIPCKMEQQNKYVKKYK